MTQYLLSVWMTEGVEPYATKEEMEQAFADVDAFNQEIQASGHWVFAGGLHPANTATVVRAEKGGDVVTTDGPAPPPPAIGPADLRNRPAEPAFLIRSIPVKERQFGGGAE